MSRIVVKIGSNILTESTGGLNQRRINTISREVADICDAGHEVVIVSSGAIAAGMVKMGLVQKPKETMLKQAAAAAGQSSLMQAYEKSFQRYNKKVAQVLLTRGVVSLRHTYLNSRNTFLTLLEYGLIPIVNENDTVATEELKFGDNDQLAAIVAGLIDADRLIILSDVEGLYSSDPKKDRQATIIPIVKVITPELKSICGGAGSSVGLGGMYSKVLAAENAMSFGISVNIINGTKKGLLVSIVKGGHHGTEFVAEKKSINSRKGWIAYSVNPKGTLVLDQGAVNALIRGGKSLLPSGVVAVEGSFNRGEAVFCTDNKGNRIAKGMVNYSSGELEKIKGSKTAEIEKILGCKREDEVIHRDDLVVLQTG